MKNKVHSEHSKNAITLLGQLIQTARKEQKFTAQEVADRAGISRNFLQRHWDAVCDEAALSEIDKRLLWER